MGLRINTNIASLTAQRHLFAATEALNKNFRRLATGERIAVAGDDAAGLAISERLRARIRSTDMATRNAQDGLSVLQSAEGSLAEIGNTLTRMRELAVQASNGVYNPSDIAALDAEFQALAEEVDRIANSTSYNGMNLLNGTISSISLQVGIDSGASDTLAITLTTATRASLGLGSTAIGSVSTARAAITAVDGAITTLTGSRGRMGASYARLETVIANLQQQSENMAAAESRIRDVDVAAETAELTKNSILQQAAVSVLAQANIQPQVALSLLQG
jgi:flagellin